MAMPPAIVAVTFLLSFGMASIILTPSHTTQRRNEMATADRRTAREAMDEYLRTGKQVRLVHWTAWVTDFYCVGAAVPEGADFQTILKALSREAELNGRVLPLDVLISEDFSNFSYKRDPVKGEMLKIVVRG
jgi:hypothetical protein